MSIFLPYPSMAHSAACLDRVRLGTQRANAQRVLAALRPHSGLPSDLVDHPGTQMWAGHEAALGVYLTLLCREWAARGHGNYTVTPYDDDWQLRAGTDDPRLAQDGRTVASPGWLGDERVHASHRAHLLSVEPEWYAQMGWEEQPDATMWWPVK